MAPRFVDEILTGTARRHDFGSAFAARHHMMSSRRDLPFTKHARLAHNLLIPLEAYRTDAAWKMTEEVRIVSRRRWLSAWPSAGLSRRCPRLCPATFSLAQGARFALAMGSTTTVPVRKDLSGQASRLSGLPPQQFEMVRASGNAPDRWHSSSATPCIRRTVRL